MLDFIILCFYFRRELITPKSQGGGTQEGFEVAKTGDARIGFIGKSSFGITYRQFVTSF